jgi:hypothetical protein
MEKIFNDIIIKNILKFLCYHPFISINIFVILISIAFAINILLFNFFIIFIFWFVIVAILMAADIWLLDGKHFLGEYLKHWYNYWAEVYENKINKI